MFCHSMQCPLYCSNFLELNQSKQSSYFRCLWFYSNDLYGLEAFDVGDAELSRSEQNLFESFDLLVSIPARNFLPSIGRDQCRRVNQSRKNKKDDNAVSQAQRHLA